MHVGIDVGADRLHCVALRTDGHLLEGRVFPPTSLREVIAWLAPADTVAIDAPATLSSAPHAQDEVLSVKFRTARCAEIALGREHRLWVPWATPTPDMQIAPWIGVGLLLFEEAAANGHVPLEVYPHAGFKVLSGQRPLPPKRKLTGLIARVELLIEGGFSASALALWSHDSLDAALAALIALQHARGTAVPVGCGHDTSKIWLPQPLHAPGSAE